MEPLELKHMEINDLVAIHTWRFADGEWYGQGTALEFNYWREQGIIPDDVSEAELLGYEHASEDRKREAAWAA